MTSMHVRKILSFVILWCFSYMVHASTLKVHIEPSQVMLGEMFELILELDENAPTGLPDFNPLAHHFYVHGTAQSTSYMFVNGQSKSATKWIVTLAPKHTGTIIIPPIQVGSLRSQPITLHVTKQGPTASKRSDSSHSVTSDDALFLKTKVSTKNPFLNQQINYTVKIYHAVSILDAAYQPPKLSDALIVTLGTNRQYQVIEKGRPYLVEEQTYAFFPQKTGPNIIFTPKFQALIYDDMPRRAEASAPSASIHVKAIPTPFTANNWLPAKAVSVSETYNDTHKHWKEGDTLTRTINIKAVGLPAELLPTPDFEKNEHFKIYTERPVLNNQVNQHDVIGKETIEIHYLLNHSGTITIPEQKILWFNTDTQQVQTIVLPARILVVTAEAKAHPKTIQSSEPPPATLKVPNSDKRVTPNWFHPSLLHLAMLCVLFTLTIGYCLLKRMKQKSFHQSDARKQARRHLKKACLVNQPTTAERALIAWARLRWPDTQILNLDDVARSASNTHLTEAIRILSKTLYDVSTASSWQGRELWRAIQTIKPSKKHASKKNQNHHLPSINHNHLNQ